MAENGQRRRRDGAVSAAAVSLLGALGGLAVLSVAALALRAVAGPWRFPDVLPSGRSSASLAGSKRSGF